jgi:SAM-dependent methyltransferase
MSELEAKGTEQPGEIDYVERWRRLVQARTDQGRRLDTQHQRGDEWAGCAERFRRLTGALTRGGTVDPFLDIVRPHIRRDATVLDVGAGAGRHVAALAPQVARVVAVEPSAAMREQMAIVLREANLTNVVVVPESWPNARVEPADLVICSHVAYFVEDIGTFLRRLSEVTRGHCFITLRNEQREIATVELFKRVWGEPRCPEPSFVDLFGAAIQVGLLPCAVTIPFAINPGFLSPEDALPMVRATLLNPEGPDVDGKIRAYLADRLVQRDGPWYWNVPPTSAGVLSWERTN